MCRVRPAAGVLVGEWMRQESADLPAENPWKIPEFSSQAY